MDFNYTLNLSETLKNIENRGAFLTVKDNDGKVNTMTIGWGSIGYEWKKPVFSVLVRESRYTYDIIENAEDFTVSVPFNDDTKDALKFCGTKSGKNFDKFKECNLTTLESKKVKSPAIKDCQMIYECKILYKQTMNLKLLNKEISEKWYASEDVHKIYYGEIVNCYYNK